MRSGAALFLFGASSLLGIAWARRVASSAPSSGPSSGRPGAAPGEGPPFGDARRLHTLDGLIPSARAAFGELLEEARRRGFRPSIISALRTCTEQASVNPKVPRSWHLLGRAIDLELPGGTPADYTSLGEWWEAKGGRWGGRWTEQYPIAPCGPVGMSGDPCHFDWTDGQKIGDVWPEGRACADVAPRYLEDNGAGWSPLSGWRV